MAGKKKPQSKKTSPENTAEEVKTEETVEETKAQETTEEKTEEAATEETVENVEAEAAKETETSEEGPVEGASDKANEKIAELEDKVKRQLAEFDNYRKRTEKEKTQMYETGAKSVLEKLLPIVDNFERAVATIKPEDAEDPHAKGLQMIYTQLVSELEKLEVKPIEAVGCEFNPDFHNAIMQQESEEYESGFVAAELQKGYTYRDTVIRHSMVAVVP